MFLPRSPDSASKAGSDPLVNAWHHTDGLPVVLTNCSNNYGPWQFPEKLIPVMILVGGHGERRNREVVEAICRSLDGLRPAAAPHDRLITRVTDRLGHDRRYAIDPTRISQELGWQPRQGFEAGLVLTVRWYLDSDWCSRLAQRLESGPGL